MFRPAAGPDWPALSTARASCAASVSFRGNKRQKAQQQAGKKKKNATRLDGAAPDILIFSGSDLFPK